MFYIQNEFKFALLLQWYYARINKWKKCYENNGFKIITKYENDAKQKCAY